MADTTETPILFAIENGLATLTLNRPHRRNALTKEMLVQLHAALEKGMASEAVRAIMITGAAGAFCAGQDLSERDPRWPGYKAFDLEQIQIELYHPIISLMRDGSKPIVAVVNGIAAGAGTGLALAADFVLAAQDAQFSFAFAKVALGADAGVGWHLTQALGPARAKAILMQGHVLSGDEAATLGLIHSACPATELVGSTDALLQELCAKPQQALRSIKAQINNASQLQFQAYLKIEAKHQGLAGFHPDYAEAVTAFLEKRSAKFK